MRLEILEKFKDRQVVVNTYMDDELINKDGFLFEKIEIIGGRIDFIKNKQRIFSIFLEKYPTFQILADFKNYFSLSNDKNEKIEIYFP